MSATISFAPLLWQSCGEMSHVYKTFHECRVSKQSIIVPVRSFFQGNVDSVSLWERGGESTPRVTCRSNRNCIHRFDSGTTKSEITTICGGLSCLSTQRDDTDGLWLKDDPVRRNVSQCPIEILF